MKKLTGRSLEFKKEIASFIADNSNGPSKI
jgi:hypothetical protein